MAREDCQRCVSILQLCGLSEGVDTFAFPHIQTIRPITSTWSDSPRGALEPLDGLLLVPRRDTAMVKHLGELHRAFPEAKPANRAYYSGRRFAAHVYQRAGLLERILEDLAAASRSGRLGPQQGG